MIECVVLQKQLDGYKKHIDYGPQTLTDAERSYDTADRECLSVVWQVLLPRPYLERPDLQ